MQCFFWGFVFFVFSVFCTVFATTYIHISVQAHLYHTLVILSQSKHNHLWRNIQIFYLLLTKKCPVFSEMKTKSLSAVADGKNPEEEGRRGRKKMTAMIIKTVQPLRYLEASLPFRLLLSNIRLVTWFCCQTQRFQRDTDRKRKKGGSTCSN